MAHLPLPDLEHIILGKGVFCLGHFLPYNKPPAFTVPCSNKEVFLIDFSIAPAFLEAEVYDVPGRPSWVREVLMARYLPVGGPPVRKRKQNGRDTTENVGESGTDGHFPQQKKIKLSSQEGQTAVSPADASAAPTGVANISTASTPAAKIQSLSSDQAGMPQALSLPHETKPSTPAAEIADADKKSIFEEEMDKYGERVRIYMDVRRFHHYMKIAEAEGRVAEGGFFYSKEDDEEMRDLKQKFIKSMDLVREQKRRARETAELKEPSKLEGMGDVGMAEERKGEEADGNKREKPESGDGDGDDRVPTQELLQRAWVETSARIHKWLEDLPAPSWAMTLESARHGFWDDWMDSDGQ